ncbi:sensor diguanylate cyclase, PAS domain-containing [Desulfuromonas soudanensis]|uniref:Sensor diguanylate cyclase, PAS domain-containing n=1 Tax=Desulfuromonas soudanensis TaxID=1603606 RepID=A0A0M4D7S3_9BACT|nr:sensor domain-containing diguanylate cyclase [Desulfuromonas soudanensis]ALC17247.1 sensor diguanylate cyclase, PAS domain-containing [Desulfuromonas soudanensis]
MKSSLPPIRPQISTLRIVFAYLVLSGVWVLYSDTLLLLMVEDSQRLTELQTVKGWLFVLVTSCFLYVLINRRLLAGHLAEREAVDRRDYYLTILEDFPALIWRAGLDTHCNYFNRTWLEFTGRPLEMELGDGWTEGVHPDDFQECVDTYLEAFAAQRPFSMEYRLRRYDGEYRWILDIGRPFFDPEGEFAGYIGSCFDITDKKLAEEQIRTLAYYDPLTSLPNRTLFQDRLNLALAQARRDGGKMAVLFLDLDRFKNINDTLGHPCGDLLLQQVAERLKTCTREGDTVARFGGDEFVILLPKVADDRPAAMVSEKILKLFESPFQLGERTLRTSTSIGYVLYPEDGQTCEDLLKHADSAMYRAKELGRNRAEKYTPEMRPAEDLPAIV